METNRRSLLSNYSPGGGQSLIDFSTPQLLDSSTSEFREQSENVYENKRKGQNVSKPGPSFPRFIAYGLTTSGGINEDGFR